MAVNEKTRLEILRFLRRFIREEGRSPSMREIALAVGLHSTASIYGYILRMEKDGLLERDPQKPRSIRPAAKKKVAPPPLSESSPPDTLKIQCDFDLPPTVNVKGIIALLADPEGNLNPIPALRITRL